MEKWEKNFNLWASRYCYDWTGDAETLCAKLRELVAEAERGAVFTKEEAVRLLSYLQEAESMHKEDKSLFDKTRKWAQM